VPGTLVKRDKPCEYRFTIHKDDARLPVTYAQCVIPDGFRDVPTGGVQVTVEGALGAAGDFQASLVMAKCSSKYDPAKHEMAGGPANAALPVN
jgi:cytochrome c-type biogenesis protein CcmE